MIVFEKERAKRILDDLRKLIYKNGIAITNYYIKDGKSDYESLPKLQEWQEFSTDDVWHCHDKHRWFKTDVEFPDIYEGEKIVFQITTGREGQWDATNPQMLFYLDGEIVQGLDVNHRRVVISDCAKSGEKHEIAFLAYGGTTAPELMIKTQVSVLDEKIEKICFDLDVAVESTFVLCDHESENERQIVEVLRDAVDLIDLRQPYSRNFYDSVETASKLLNEKLYSQKKYNQPLVSAIGHTHIDIAWLWTVEQTKEKVLRSFATVLELMKRYPDYKFMSSQPLLYKFVKEQEPKMYEQIKQRISEGRWEVDGGMWVEADCNIPSGESLIRQFLKGEQFIREEFGVKSRSLWLPDVFGYSAALPQILKGFGINYFMTTKISWNQYNQLPNDTFMWRGLDGTEVFTFMPTTCNFEKRLAPSSSFSDRRNTTTYTGRIEPNMIKGTHERFQNKELTDNTLMLFGYGDGGGGPTYEMLEKYERLKNGLPGIPAACIEGERDFFDRTYNKSTQSENMPTWDGELYFEYHRGTYTSVGKNKRYNRQAETAYQNLEKISVIAEMLGGEYPKNEIDRGWETILTNQFHDIIPGSSIGEVYDQTDIEYKEILNSAEKQYKKQIEYIGNQAAAAQNSIIVFNSSSNVESAHVTVSGVKGVAYVLDYADKEHPVQYINEDTFIFKAHNLPSIGYKIYRYVLDNRLEDSKKSEFKNGHYENDFYSIEFNEKLEITSLIEKQTGYEMIKKNVSANRLISYEDRPMKWDNWDVDKFYQRKLYYADSSSKIEIIEQGSIRTTLKIEHTFADSKILQMIHLYHDSPRIDFENKVNWQNHNTMLKVHFPVDIYSKTATFDIQFGNVEREMTNNHSWDTAKFETCGHKWVDISCESHGMSLMSDCKYGYHAKDGDIGISLIKAGTYPYEDADIGEHEFTYSIYPHKGTWRQADTVSLAQELNNSLKGFVIEQGNSENSLTEKSFFSCDTNNCIIDTVKKAEDGKGYIIRVYENQNKRCNVNIQTTFSNIAEMNMMEENIQEVSSIEDLFSFNIKPYEIKTFRVW